MSALAQEETGSLLFAFGFMVGKTASTRRPGRLCAIADELHARGAYTQLIELLVEPMRESVLFAVEMDRTKAKKR